MAFFVFNAAMAVGGIARSASYAAAAFCDCRTRVAPVNGEPIDVETIVFATAVVATVLIGQRMRVWRQ